MKGITLSKLFGDCPNVKILECFADNYKEDLSVSDIIYMCDVPRTTVYRKIKKLVEDGIIKETKRYGKTKLYRLNMENEIAKAIVYLETLIARKELEKTMKREGVEIPIGRVYSETGEMVSTIDYNANMGWEEYKEKQLDTSSLKLVNKTNELTKEV